MMDRGDTVKNSVTDAEPTYDTRQAKQRATVKWLLSKAFNNKVPENLREPFYRNHENQEHVKPQVLHALANAELYCLALGNIYSDPNYHNLNHWGVLQALNRKNISINEPHLTETVLIQTNPLKMSAHMTVMEAVMTLYTKEVATPDRVLAAVRRFSQNSSINDEPPDHEKALVMWINEAVKALRQRILQETGQGDQSRIPDIPPITDVQELCDGIGLAALVSFYCPDDLPWRKIVVNKVPTISDCVRNLLLVHDFCQQSLPYSIFHMMPEDVSYLRGSMKSNLIVFLADLFNVLEIHPAKCVRFDHAAASLTDGAVMSPVVNKKSSQSNQEYFNDDRRNTEDQFVVHRGRSVPTLSSVAHNNIAEKSPISNDVAAGRPSNWEDSRRSSYAGRRSRRNSLSEDSQLTVENFGGSQENLQFLGRNPDKEPAVHVGRKDPSPSPSPKTIAQENRNSSGLHSVLINNLQNESNEVVSPSPKPSLSRQSSLRSKSSNHAETMSSAGLQQSLFDPEEEVVPVKRNSEPAIKRNSDVPAIKRNSEVSTQEKKVTSFANLPSNTTTWQQQRDINSHVQTEREETETETEVMGSQLLNIRLKLEEKRRLIESEKRRMEAVFNKQRQQFGKAAFLQAVTKGKSGEKTSNCNTPDSDPGQQVSNGDSASHKSDKPQRPFSLQDISEVEQKWLDGKSQNLAFLEDKKTPDYDNMDLEQYQKSMSQMNSSLHEIQEDLQRLTLQQKQMRQEEPAPVQMQSFASLSQNKPTMQSFVVNNHQTSLSVNQQQSMFNQPANQMNHINNHLQSEQQWHSLQQPQLMNSFANHQNHQNHQPMLINQQQPINSYISQPTVNNYVNNRQQSYAQQQSQPLNNYMNQQQTMSSNYVNQSPSSFTVSHLPVNNYSKQDSGSNFSSPQRQMHSLVNDHPQSQINTNTYSVNQQNMQYRSFVSTNNSNQQSTFSQQQQQVNQLIRNSQESSDQSSPSSQFFLHDQPSQRKTWQQTTPVNISTEPRNTWVNNRLNNRQSQPSSLSSSPLSNSGFTLHHNGSSDHSAPTPPPRRSSNSSITHAPVPTPSVDDMEPQSISFIVKSNEKMTDEEEFSEGLSRLQITSGNRTYRIPSPTRSHARLNQQNMQSQNQPEKGFYISFDDDSPPKRPKPPLRVKRASPKKERGLTQIVESNLNNINHDPINFGQDDYRPSPNRADRSPPKRTVFPQPSIKNEPTSVPDSPLSAKQRPTTNVGLIIDNELNNCDPSTIDEMERRKERILLLSLQRRQQQEELKARKELEAQQRREKEKQKEEDRARKKEEEKARRAAILEQYKLKKAIEEAEREGKNIDKELQNSLKLSNLGNRGPPRLRNKQNTRPRPKTIHIDHGHHHSDHTDGMLTPSSGKKGSTSNLSVLSSPMRRDYYRGSQDCLAETRRTSVSGASLYSDYGEDSRGASPGRSLGRRSSYKTSRDPSPEGLRSKSKFNTYATRRKSNSLMNLSGSSCEQDSLLYRYGDTDSGLGRATPPRRAPSPGHPPSPSGPGSLPARRRYNDDTASESGGSEYSGPRLYKQPATKSNRGIILNAVEYCVFPGVVNKDAKRRVLDEINRSEAKHFLILFRDAGCQFRALYSYCPDSEEVAKLYGTGPKLVTDRMFDKFFKYNSGGKCFSQVHTKHLTVTIDAFTIHNSLWQGKKMVNLPSKRDMTLVI